MEDYAGEPTGVDSFATPPEMGASSEDFSQSTEHSTPSLESPPLYHPSPTAPSAELIGKYLVVVSYRSSESKRFCDTEVLDFFIWCLCI